MKITEALCLLFLTLFTTPVNAQPCNLTGSWTGGSALVTVLEAFDGTFTANASGAWTNAPGKITSNTDIYLDCCEPSGLHGTIDPTCSRIQWDDPPASVWRRPQNVTISNILPRVDEQGEILRVQDGCLQNFKGIYYLYGAKYQCCPVDEQPECYQKCGWRNTTFAVYSSMDLQQWHLESEDIMPVFSDPNSSHSNRDNAYFEPCVIYSPAADHYALWFLSTNTKAVAVSDSPIGPFESVTWDTGLKQGSDSYYWTDFELGSSTYGNTYVKHNTAPPSGSDLGAHQVSLLAPDLLSVLSNASSPLMTVPATPIPPYYQGTWPTCSEGGGIFKYNKRWYVMAGACCCFCEGGANGYVWATKDEDPLGEYFLQDDVGIIPWNATQKKYLTGAQQFSVAQLHTTNGLLPVYIGQRFGSADDGLKCHDYQVWVPLTLTPSGVVHEMSWVNEFTVELV